MCSHGHHRVFLAGIDGSENSYHALSHACDISRPGDKLVVVHVAPEATKADLQEVTKRVVAENLRASGGQFCSTEYYFEVGDKPGEVIATQARLLAVDCIVIGSRGLTGIKKALLGSVSSHVVNHAPCPVLVVKDKNCTEAKSANH